MASLPSPSRPARSKFGAISAVGRRNPPARPARCGCRAAATSVSLPDQVLVGKIVHPVEVGRDEDVGRRALLDLLGERRARRIGDRRLLAGVRLPGGVDVVERVLQAGRGEDGDLRLRERGRRRGEEHRGQAADESGEPQSELSASEHVHSSRWTPLPASAVLSLHCPMCPLRHNNGTTPIVNSRWAPARFRNRPPVAPER